MIHYLEENHAPGKAKAYNRADFRCILKKGVGGALLPRLTGTGTSVRVSRDDPDERRRGDAEGEAEGTVPPGRRDAYAMFVGPSAHSRRTGGVFIRHVLVPCPPSAFCVEEAASGG